jgi:uncharacterized protein YdeI (YjbR/CyaY-like superfamily)
VAKPTFFATPRDLRAWLSKHHGTARELVVGFYRKSTGKPSLTWPESVDEALCFGWIDGIRRKVDEDSYSIRFTPRRPESIWSAVNIKRIAELKKLGLIQEAGVAAFEKRTAKKSGVYSYEQRHSAVLEPALEKQLKADKKAFSFFQTLPPGYRQLAIFFIGNAKQPETRVKRLQKLMSAWAQGRRE